MEPEVRKPATRFREIDLLRFLAAISVLFYHYTYRGHAADNLTPFTYPELGKVTRYGYLGVELFFIISGFAILISSQGKTVRQFFLSRVTRLYPAYWVACTLTFLVKFIWGRGLPSPYLQTGLGRYAYGMTMLQEFFGVPSLDGSYWTLGVEITFYFLIAVLMGWQLLRHTEWVVAAWLAYAALVGPTLAPTRFAYLLLPTFAPFFAAGVIFYLLQQRQTRLRFELMAAAYALAIRSTIQRAHDQTEALHGVTSGWVAALVVTSFFAVFYLIITRRLDLSRFAWLSLLGSLTYPLYLVHSDMAFVFFHRVGYQFNKYGVLVGTLLFMLGLAYLIHRFAEKPTSKWLGRKLSDALHRLDKQ